MAQIGLRTTGQTITETRLPRRVDEHISDLDPQEAPMITFLMKMKGKRKPTDSYKVEWFEQDYVARWTTAASTIHFSASSTTLVVADGTLFVVGDVFIAPLGDSVSTVPEQIIVSAVSGNTLTIVRGASPQTVNMGQSLRILGNAYEENGVTPNPKVASPVAKSTFTQIFRTSVSISGSQLAMKAYGAPNGEIARERAKKLKEHKRKMNDQFLFGTAVEGLTAGANGYRRSTTMGLNSVVTTNVVDASGTLTRKAFEAFSATAFRHGAKTKLLLASPLVMSALHDWGNSFMQMAPGGKVFGVDLEKVIAGHGTWMLARDWMFEDGAGSSLNGFAGWAFSVDPDNLEYYYLSANGNNRDTHMIEDAIKDGRDGQIDEYLTECAFAVKQEQQHAKLYDVTDYSA